MNLYELNKNLYKTAPPLSTEELQELKSKIGHFIIDTKQQYYLALSQDQRYYTIFHFQYKMSLDKDVQKLYESIKKFCGPILDVSIEEDRIEIWYKDLNDEEPKIVLFFPYDSGVIECV